MANESDTKALVNRLKEYLPELINYYFETIYDKLSKDKDYQISFESVIPSPPGHPDKFPLAYSYSRNILYATLLRRYFEREFFRNPHLFDKFPANYIYITKDNGIAPFDDFEERNSMVTIDSYTNKLKSVKIDSLLEDIRKEFLGIYIPKIKAISPYSCYDCLYAYDKRFGAEMGRIGSNKNINIVPKIISIIENVSKSFYSYKYYNLRLKLLLYQIILYHFITKSGKLLIYPVLETRIIHKLKHGNAFDEELSLCFELDIDDLRDNSEIFKNKLENMIKSLLMTSLIDSASDSEQDNV